MCITRTWLCTSFHHYLLSCVHHTHLAVYLFPSLFVIPCASHAPGCVPLFITVCYPVCITHTLLCTSFHHCLLSCVHHTHLAVYLFSSLFVIPCASHTPCCVPLSITVCYPVCITRTWLCTSFHHCLLSRVHHTHLAVYLFPSLFVILCASHAPGCVPLFITVCYPVCITCTWLCTSFHHYLLSCVHHMHLAVYLFPSLFVIPCASHAPGCVPLSITICYPVCITRTWLCTSFHHYLLSCAHHTHLAVYLFPSLFVIPCASHTPGCVPLSITICYPVCITHTWLCTSFHHYLLSHAHHTHLAVYPYDLPTARIVLYSSTSLQCSTSSL